MRRSNENKRQKSYAFVRKGYVGKKWLRTQKNLFFVRGWKVNIKTRSVSILQTFKRAEASF